MNSSPENHKEPLKLEVGKWYITKDGTIGQLEQTGNKCYPYLLCNISYTAEGRFRRHDDCTSDIDREVKVVVTELDGSPLR